MSLFSQFQELIEDKLGTQPRQAQPEDEAMAVKAIANDLDVDKLGVQFTKFAGHDDCLSKTVRAPRVAPPCATRCRASARASQPPPPLVQKHPPPFARPTRPPSPTRGATDHRSSSCSASR